MNVSNDNVVQVLDKLKNRSVFVIDIETSGLEIMYDDFLCGIGVCISTEDTFYFPFRHTVGENLDEKYLKELIKILEGNILIGHNIKFDLKGLYKEGLDPKKCILIDTIVAARLCSNDKTFSLDLNSCSEKFLHFGSSNYKKEHKEYLRKNKIKRHCDADPEIEGKYCCKDLLNTLKLFLVLGKKVKASGQSSVQLQECKLTSVLLNMEIYGVRIDLEYCAKSFELLKKKSFELEKEIFKMFGKEFNINSTQQLSEAMNSVGLKSPVRTVKGAPSWGAKALAQVEHPITNKILEYRAIQTFKNTFFGPLLERGREIVSTSFKNWKAITGRLSCEDPNLQNIPKSTRNLNSDLSIDSEDEDLMKVVRRVVASGSGGRGLSVGTNTGKEKYNDEVENLVSARRLFIPRDGSQLFSVDVKQMEVAVLCYYGKEELLLNEMSGGNFDFHDFITIEAFGIKPGAPNFSFFREISKGITFGVVYGMGDYSLSVNLGKTLSEARKFKDKYLKRIPKAHKWMEDIKNTVSQGNPIYNDYGRKYVISPEMAYRAVNYMVQGTAGEIIKEVMINMDKFLENKKSKILIQIHDELLFEIYDDERYLLSDIVKIMKTNKLNVPLNMEVKLCEGSWANKKEYVIKTN